jgi:hypothetical protein
MQTTGETAEAEPISKRRGDNDVADILSAVTFTWNPVRKLKTDHLSRSPFARRLVGALIAFLILVPLLLILFRPGTTEAAWYSDTWRFRKLITIDHFKVPSTQTNFPVLVAITDAGLKSNTQQTGNDILFTSSDGSTKLSHEIETFATGSGKLNAWVKIPSLSSTTDTKIYMYYGNPSSPNQQDPVNVWDTNFKGVWHMKENPAGAAPQIKDSTTNANNGTSNGSMTESQQTAGQINGGVNFDGVDDYVNVPDSSSLSPTTAVTVSVWFKQPSVNASAIMGLVCKDISGGITNCTYLMGFQQNSSQVFVRITQSNNTACDFTSGTLSLNVWHHAVLTFTANNEILYIDGVQVGSNTTCTNIGDSTGTLNIGQEKNGSSRWFNGLLDDVRVSNSVRSADWIATEYNNQSNPATFLSVGLQAENKGAPIAWYKFDEGQGTIANNSGNCGTTCNGTLTSMASFGQKTQTYYFTRAYGLTIARSSSCISSHYSPYSLSTRGKDWGGMTHGLEAAAWAYDGLRRGGTPPAQRVSGRGKPHLAPPNQGTTGAADRCGAEDPCRDWPEAG